MDDLLDHGKKGKLPIRKKDGERPYFKWSEAYDKCILNLLIEQINEGRRLMDGTFSKDVWDEVVSRFNEEMSVIIDRDNIRYRLRQLKRAYTTFKALKETSGFGWEEVSKRVTASKPQWDEYIKSHPEAKEYMYKGNEYWDELCIVLGNSTATGEHSLTSKENRRRIEEDVTYNDIGFDDVHIIVEENEDEQECRTKKRRKGSSSSNVGQKNNVEDKEGVMMLIDALENFHEKKYQKKAEYEGRNWLATLNEIPDLDLNLKLCASQFMTTSEIKLHFISMSIEERRAWLTLMAARSQID